MKKGKELKAPHYASAATRDYITTRDIIPNSTNIKLKCIKYFKTHRTLEE